MIQANEFLSAARKSGFDFYTGVPCSYLTALINRLSGDPAIGYVGATSEGEAVGIAAGAWLAGRMPVVMCQNSGLGNTVNPLTSLNHAFKIPSLLIVTWRGQPGHHDEPQHAVMGQVMHELLNAIHIPHDTFPQSAELLAGTLSEALDHMNDNRLPFALVTPKDTFEHQELGESDRPQSQPGQLFDYRGGNQRPTRISILDAVLGIVPENAGLIATTGKCGRELFTLADRRQHLYLVGSMGCASAVGLGVSLNVPNPVVILDGDGAALMKMGNLATIGAYAPNNLVHVLLDNGVHDSTGGQPTVSNYVQFADVAIACNYHTAAECDDVQGFDSAMKAALSSAGPHLVRAHIRPGSLEKLGRPTIGPTAVADRFREFLKTAQCAVRESVAI
jgi:phosphonopyruvate decarboxylase